MFATLLVLLYFGMAMLMLVIAIRIFLALPSPFSWAMRVRGVSSTVHGTVAVRGLFALAVFVLALWLTNTFNLGILIVPVNFWQIITVAPHQITQAELHPCKE